MSRILWHQHIQIRLSDSVHAVELRTQGSVNNQGFHS